MDSPRRQNAPRKVARQQENTGPGMKRETDPRASGDADALGAALLAQNIGFAAAFGLLCGMELSADVLPRLGGTITQN